MRILITEPQNYSAIALGIYSSLGEIVCLSEEDNLEDTISDFDIVVVRLAYKFSTDILGSTKLQFIVSPTTGLDHIDIKFAKSKGIEILSLKDELEFLRTIPSTAEHTWALLLAIFRNIVPASQSVESGYWDRQSFRGNNLAGKKLGILGLGRVGNQVAEYARAFGMSVGFYDPNVETLEIWKTKFQGLEELLKWCDILSIHIPLDDESVDLLSYENLQHLRRRTLRLGKEDLN